MPACRNTIATTMTTVASDSASRNSSANSTTSALGVGTPASASTRKRAGSAPDRAGVIDAPKSPASVVRSAVMKLRQLDVRGLRAPRDLPRCASGSRRRTAAIAKQMRPRRQHDRAAGAPPPQNEEHRDANHRRERHGRERPTLPRHASRIGVDRSSVSGAPGHHACESPPPYYPRQRLHTRWSSCYAFPCRAN